MYNRCLDHTLDVQRHSPSIAVGASRISFRQFKFQAKSFKRSGMGKGRDGTVPRIFVPVPLVPRKFVPVPLVPQASVPVPVLRDTKSAGTDRVIEKQ